MANFPFFPLVVAWENLSSQENFRPVDETRLLMKEAKQLASVADLMVSVNYIHCT